MTFPVGISGFGPYGDKAYGDKAYGDRCGRGNRPSGPTAHRAGRP